MTIIEKAPLGLGDIVRVVFKGWQETVAQQAIDNSLSIMWDSKPYTLLPGHDSFIPFEAAACWFGDPRSGERVISNRDNRGLVGFIPDRATEVRRLRTKYDNQGGSDERLYFYPIVEVYDLEGQRITTVLDDPKGDSVMAARPTVSDNAQLLDIVTKQQKTIDFLMQQIGVTPEKEVTDQVVTDFPDEPDAEPPSTKSEYPPEDEGIKMPTSEAATGERGGRPSDQPAVDWSSLAMRADD